MVSTEWMQLLRASTQVWLRNEGGHSMRGSTPVRQNLGRECFAA